MKILHLNTERGWRGGERQTLWLARELARRGHDSRLACRPGGPLAEAAAQAGVPVVPVQPLFEFDPAAVWRLRGALAGTDVLHAHTGHAAGLGALACLGRSAKFVVTRRVDFPLGTGFLSRWKYGRAAAVACISSRVRDVAVDGGVPTERTVLIPSGIDAAGYPSSADGDRLRRDQGFRPDEALVVHAAALTPHKDQATLLRALQRVVLESSKVRLLILGDGPSRGALVRLARELGLSERVSFLGYRPDVLEWVAMADLFVFSSTEEGLGTAILDALALGVPTAATSAGGIPDIYGGPAAPELSPPGDPAALARNMLAVLTDPAEARRRVERGRELVKRFTVASMTDAYERLYAGLCA